MSGKAQPRTSEPPAPLAGARWVPLTQGRFALVDEADWSRVEPHAWCFYQDEREATGYAQNRRLGRMHRFLLGNPPGLVDHENGNGLDNRRQNLRAATRTQNNRNARKRRDSSRPYKGVYPYEGRWYAYIRVDGKRKSCGGFSTAVEAARAYDAAATERFGEFARLNFPEEK